MSLARRLPQILLLAVALCAAAFAQSTTNNTAPQSPVRITVSLTAQGLRFAALGHVTQIRLEVFGPSGEQLFSSGFLAGNVRDWAARDPQGRPLPDGPYTCVVTAREAGGQVSAREGELLVAGGQVSLQLGGGGRVSEVAAGAEQPRQAGAQAAPAAEAVGSSEAGAMTVVAHDGHDGQVTATAGALTFRTGDFFAGRDRERMRVTPEGRVGIGTSEPRATPDVAGAVRAAGGFRFADSSVLNSAVGKLTLRNAAGQALTSGGLMAQAVNGTGTQNSLAKWADASTLGASDVTEVGGKVGIGIGASAPPHPLTVRQNGGSAGVHTIGELFVDRDDRSRSASLVVGTAGTLKWIFGMPSQDDAFQLYDLTNKASRFYVDSTTGNVGVGTNSPAQRLDVAGDVNATQYDIRGNPVLRIGVGNTFVGALAGPANTGEEGNTFVGIEAGLRNGQSDTNNTANNNTFVGVEAGQFNNTGFSNTVLGAYAEVGAGNVGNLTNATAIGASALATRSNSLVLGSIKGVNGASADTNVGIGTTAPTVRLQVVGGDLGISTQGKGLILRATDGPSCFRLTVNNTGTLRVLLALCP